MTVSVYLWVTILLILCTHLLKNKVGVVYSGEYDVCDVTPSVYPHRASLKNMPGHGGNRTYDLWNTSPMLCQLHELRGQVEPREPT